MKRQSEREGGFFKRLKLTTGENYSQSSTDDANNYQGVNADQSILNTSQDLSICFLSFFSANINHNDGRVICLLDRECGSDLLKKRNQTISEQFKGMLCYLEYYDYFDIITIPETGYSTENFLDFDRVINGQSEKSSDFHYQLALFLSTHKPKLYSKLPIYRMYPKSKILEMMKYGDTVHFENSYNEYRMDKEFVLKAISISPSCFIYIDESLKEDMEVVLETVKLDGFMLEKMKKIFRNNSLVVSTAISNNAFAIQFATNRIKKDFDIVLQAAKQDGMVLEILDKSFLSNVEIMTCAVRSNFDALSLITNRRVKKEVLQKVNFKFRK